MSTTPKPARTRAAQLHRERPESSPAKSPDAKRTAVESELEKSHALTKKAISAKAMEGARKYLDGVFGPVGGQFVMQRACAWERARRSEPPGTAWARADRR